MADIQNGSVTITGLDAFEKKIKELQTTSPGFEKRLRGVIRQVMGEARAALQRDAQSGLQIQSDPRKAYKAVRYAVYRKIFGGQVNILDGRKTVKGNYEPPRKGVSGRGGNRRLRSQRTQDLLSYEGASRAFVLRFLNQGTRIRYAGYGRNGKTEADYLRFVANNGNRGFRGSISARNWFGSASHAQLERAAGKIQEIIDRIINDEFV